MAGFINNWQQQIKAAERQTAEFPAWLKDKQAAALEQLATMQSPNRKMEHWRYTDAARLLSEKSAKQIEPRTIDADLQITFSETGVALSGDLPKWLKVVPIQTISQAKWRDIKSRHRQQEQGMLQLNSALFNQGIELSVQSDTQQADYKIALVYAYQSEQWQFVRNRLRLATNSKIQLAEYFLGGQVNIANDWLLATDSKLYKTTLADLSEQDKLLCFNFVELQKNAQIEAMNRCYNGYLQHHIQQVVLAGEGALYNSGSINKSNENSNIADIVNVFYDSKNGSSTIVKRNVAEAEAQIFTNAKAWVPQGSDGAFVDQDLKSILLSAKAKAFNKPELEVNTDEVVAAHGSTIGALDQTVLFYLKSRGIDQVQAEEIMIKAFMAEAEIC